MPIEPELLEILACPESRAAVVHHTDADGEWLISTDAETRRRYAIRDGIPIMLIDESEQMDADAWSAALSAAGHTAS